VSERTTLLGGMLRAPASGVTHALGNISADRADFGASDQSVRSWTFFVAGDDAIDRAASAASRLGSGPTRGLSVRMAAFTLDAVIAGVIHPGIDGVVLAQRTVIFNDLWRLTVALGGVEVCLVRRDGRFHLYSGTANRCPTGPIAADKRIIAHTHPSGSPQPSRQDIAALDAQFLMALKHDRYALVPISRVIWGTMRGDFTIFRPVALR